MEQERWLVTLISSPMAANINQVVQIDPWRVCWATCFKGHLVGRNTNSLSLSPKIGNVNYLLIWSVAIWNVYSKFNPATNCRICVHVTILQSQQSPWLFYRVYQLSLQILCTSVFVKFRLWQWEMPELSRRGLWRDGVWRRRHKCPRRPLPEHFLSLPVLW